MNGLGVARQRLLLRFARLAAESGSPESLFPRLIEACVAEAGVGADAACVLEVEGEGRLRVAVSKGLPEAVSGWSEELETLDAEIGKSLRAASGQLSRAVRTFPLVSGRDIYGALVIFSGEGGTITEEQVELAEGLSDLAAVAMDKAAQAQTLMRSYAELRASREALAKSEKLRALGEMAAGISHDLKNILNPLALQTQLLRRRLEKNPEKAMEVLGHMDEAIRSGVDVVERLRAFSRQAPEAHAEPVDLAAAATTAAELCRPRLKSAEGVDLELACATAPTVTARRSEMVTAVVNLLFNAIDALPGRGKVAVRTGAAEGGGWIEVADTGPGMSEDVQKRVFEPFFTTKAHGTGLGLAMVYAFVKRYHGKVSLDTAPGKGTRFRLWFPSNAGLRATDDREAPPL